MAPQALIGDSNLQCCLGLRMAFLASYRVMHPENRQFCTSGKSTLDCRGVAASSGPTSWQGYFCWNVSELSYIHSVSSSEFGFFFLYQTENREK